MLFADLAGFTALTEAHGNEAAARIASRLGELVRLSAGNKARMVKPLGDGSLLVFDDVGTAVGVARDLAVAAASETRFLGLRAGLDAGSVVAHEGDFFGTTLNVAARLMDRATSGQILVTRRAADRLLTGSMDFVQRPPMRLRNVRAPVAVVEMNGPQQSAFPFVDPVCRMRLSRDTPGIVNQRVGGGSLRFCSLQCASTYMEDTRAVGRTQNPEEVASLPRRGEDFRWPPVGTSRGRDGLPG